MMGFFCTLPPLIIIPLKAPSQVWAMEQHQILLNLLPPSLWKTLASGKIKENIFPSADQTKQYKKLCTLLLQSSSLLTHSPSFHSILKGFLFLLSQQISNPTENIARPLLPNLIQEERPCPLSTIMSTCLPLAISFKISKDFDSTPF